MTYPWKVEVRNSGLYRVGELDDYQQLDMLLKFNDVSTWQLRVDRANRLAAALVAPGAGIVVSRDGQTILSGVRVDREDNETGDANTITLSGVDDTAWLKWRAAHPQPLSTAPPYSTQAEDVRTGAASTVMRQYVGVNISVEGATPTIPARQVSGFIRSADIAYGETVTGRARWQNLLAMLQELAVAGAVGGIPVGFKVVQSGATLVYTNYQPVDRTADAIFSKGFRNVRSITYRESAPEANYWFVGGSGSGTSRAIYEMPDTASIAVWGRREGEFVDASSAGTTAELHQAALKAKADTGPPTSLTVTPIATDRLAFGVHYGLGDRVTAVMAPVGASATEVVVQDILRQCRLALTPDSADVVAAVGSDNANADKTFTKIFQRIRRLGVRMNNAERG